MRIVLFILAVPLILFAWLTLAARAPVIAAIAMLVAIAWFDHHRRHAAFRRPTRRIEE